MNDEAGSRHIADARRRYWARVGGEKLRGGADMDFARGAGEGDSPQDSRDDFKWFHYIPRDYIKEWEALGWKVASDLPDYHGQFSVLGEWTGEGEPVKP